MENFELTNFCRNLSDSEILYKVTNNKETSERVAEIFGRGDKIGVEEVFNQLTPARKDMAFAVIELYKRLQERRQHLGLIRYSKDVYSIMHPYLCDNEIEECWVIAMNQSSRIIRKIRISQGGISSTQVDVRVVLGKLLEVKAVSFILVHNHPSGNIAPSRDDDRLTETLSKAGKTLNIRLLDHVIITEGAFYSYSDEGRI